MRSEPVAGDEHLPPSALYVRYVIAAADGWISRQDLIAETELPPSTVTFACDRLLSAGEIESKPVATDPDQLQFKYCTSRTD